MTKAKHGGRRKGAGRLPKNLRKLDITDMGVEFDEPPAFYSADLTVMVCGGCGVVSVEIGPIKAFAEDGADGYEQIAMGEIADWPDRHSPNCPHN